jgi:hypothetical protein
MLQWKYFTFASSQGGDARGSRTHVEDVRDVKPGHPEVQPFIVHLGQNTAKAAEDDGLLTTLH